MAVNDGEKASTIFAIDQSGREWEMFRCERPGFDSDGEGQGIQNAIPCPSRTSIPAQKAELSILRRSGTFYFALTSAHPGFH
jgi:hypothetical protein